MKDLVTLIVFVFTLMAITIYYMIPILFPEIDVCLYREKIWYYPIAWTIIGYVAMKLTYNPKTTDKKQTIKQMTWKLREK